MGLAPTFRCGDFNMNGLSVYVLTLIALIIAGVWADYFAGRGRS